MRLKGKDLNALLNRHIKNIQDITLKHYRNEYAILREQNSLPLDADTLSAFDSNLKMLGNFKDDMYKLFEQDYQKGVSNERVNRS